MKNAEPRTLEHQRIMHFKRLYSLSKNTLNCVLWTSWLFRRKIIAHVLKCISISDDEIVRLCENYAVYALAYNSSYLHNKCKQIYCESK